MNILIENFSSFGSRIDKWKFAWVSLNTSIWRRFKIPIDLNEGNRRFQNGGIYYRQNSSSLIIRQVFLPEGGKDVANSVLSSQN